jgi:hypothetical protein
MPEARDKNGPPGLEIEVRCSHLDCGHVGKLAGAEADQLAGRLWASSRRDGKLHIRELIARLYCEKCQRRFASVSFSLTYRGYPLNERQHHDHRQYLPDE